MSANKIAMIPVMFSTEEIKKGIEAIRVDNKHWKKEVISKGNASKTEIKNYAIDKWGDIFPEQDYADAACIA